MEKQEWLDYANKHAEVLRGFISSYHPTSRVYGTPALDSALDLDLSITAPAAEQACQVVRQMIVAKGLDNPVDRFNAALASGDCSELYSVLNRAWFGVPESTSCWRIEGFSEAVDLLEDPPDEEEQAK